jgi:hypothetical protein
MAKKDKLIPFRWLPASWGLVDKAYESAKAYYELDGEELERRNIEIFAANETEKRSALLRIDWRYDKISEYDFEVELAKLQSDDGELTPQAKLAIDLKFDKITAYEHDCKLAKLNYPDENSLEHQIAMLTADYDHGKIEKLEYEKTLATAKDEPWIGVVDNGFNPEDGVNGLYFELDWNTQWVDFLRKNDYHGLSDELIVEQWFSDVCQAQVDETPPDPNEPIPFNSGRTRRVRKNGGTEYY